jgi:polyisoprenoid-binding protein YceI
MTKIVLAAVLAALPLAASATTKHLEADPAHSHAGFAVKHMMFTTVRGTFNKFTSTLDWDDADPTKSAVTTTIDAASIDTHNEGRDKHLKSPDFFDAEKCPQITFKSTKVEKAGDNQYKVTGDLTMHCVTKSVTLNALTDGKPHKTPFGTEIHIVSADTKLKRSDFGLTWNKAIEGGGVLVSDDVELDFSLEYAAPKAAAAKATKAEAKDSSKQPADKK